MATKVSFNGTVFYQNNYNIPPAPQRRIREYLEALWIHVCSLYQQGKAMPLEVSLDFPAGNVTVVYLDADDVKVQLPQLTKAGLVQAMQSICRKSGKPFSPQLPSHRKGC